MGLLSAPMTIRTLIEDFANQLSSLMERQALDRARVAVEHALGGKRSPGRPPKMLSALGLGGGGGVGSIGRKPRRKGPKQLCPVPGCKNPAAPVFGMVCAKHKNVSKTKIREYREARRRAKTEGTSKGRSPGRPRSRPAKPTRRVSTRRGPATKGAAAEAAATG